MISNVWDWRRVRVSEGERESEGGPVFFFVLSQRQEGRCSPSSPFSSPYLSYASLTPLWTMEPFPPPSLMRRAGRTRRPSQRQSWYVIPYCLLLYLFPSLLPPLPLHLPLSIFSLFPWCVSCVRCVCCVSCVCCVCAACVLRGCWCLCGMLLFFPSILMISNIIIW